VAPTQQARGGESGVASSPQTADPTSSVALTTANGDETRAGSSFGCLDRSGEAVELRDGGTVRLRKKPLGLTAEGL
jgi:hypothetical protein